jgi:hypothetical protein
MNKNHSAQHNIAKGWGSSKFGYCSPYQAFVSVDNDTLRKPNLPYCQSLAVSV